MTLPKMGTAQRGSAGIGAVVLIASRPRDANGLGHIFRPQPDGDVGIDGHLEIVDSIAGTPTGRILGVQVKAGPSYFRRSSLVGWTVAIKKSTVTYWRQYAVPVILVIVDPNAVDANWVRVDVADFPAAKRAFNIAVPRANVFSSTTAELLAQIAAPVPASLLMRSPIMRRGIVLVCLPPPTAAFARSRGFVARIVVLGTQFR